MLLMKVTLLKLTAMSSIRTEYSSENSDEGTFVRDELIGWNSADREKRLVNVMDAYVLGAVPPYNFLLGGKLVAALVRTKEVRNDFAERYGNTRGIISKKKRMPNW